MVLSRRFMVKKFVKRLFNKFLYTGLILSGLLSISSCTQDEPVESPFVDPAKPSDSTVLIYAVATNSLSANLLDSYYGDKKEMLDAAADINLKNNNVILFQTVYGVDEETEERISRSSLLKIRKTGEDYDWELIKEYDDDIAALNPLRISEVIDFVTQNFAAKNFGLVFWSHSTASQPYFPEYNVESYSSSEPVRVELPSQGSFGQDIPVGNKNPFYQINVDDLANAVPDNLFHYIWFDSCYMSNIETVYQFRKKCKIYVGYPTEVMDMGMPYQYTLPLLVGESPDLVGAAETFFDYYKNSIATIAVADMSQIDEFASFCNNYFQTGYSVNVSDLKQYTRYSTGPFYDLGDYIKAMASAADLSLTNEEWNEALNKFIIYKAATPGDFNYPSAKPIYPERYSGLSTHVYSFGSQDSMEESYYKYLDWFKAVF